jgi:ribonuclease J
VRPRIAVPVHGEARHLAEHAAFAKSLQVPQAVILNNGDVLRLAPGEPAVAGEVPAGRLALDGDADLVAPEGELVRRRRRLMYNGVAVANLVFDPEGGLEAEPAITLVGVAEDESDGFEAEVADAVARAVEGLPGRLRFDDDKVVESATKALRAAVRRRIDRRPHVEIRIARVR